MNFSQFLVKTGGLDPELLDKEQLHALYEQGLQIQSRISEMENKLRLDNANNPEILALLKEKREKLTKIRERFKYHLRRQPDYAKIRANARRYVYFQRVDNINLPILSTMMDSVRNYVHHIFKKNIRSTKYFRLYANHLNYMHDDSVKEILLNHFSSLLDKQKEIFIDQLNKQSFIVQDKVLSTQTLQDLIELRTECFRLNFPALRKTAKEYRTKLIEKINAARHAAKESMEHYALLYLKKHNEILAQITGSYANDLTSLTLIQISKKTYQLHVEDEDHSRVIPYTLGALDVIEFASAYFIEEQKIALKEILFPPVYTRNIVNDSMYEREPKSRIQ